jgi:hypothetical protein
MTLELIRQKTRDLNAKTRRGLLGGTAVSLFVVGFSGLGIAWVDDTALRAVFAVAIVWTLAGQYFVNRGMWPATLPQDSAPSTGLESYRREVERRRYLLSCVLLWSFGPVMLTVATFTVHLVRLGIRNGMLLNMIPFLALLVAWIAGVFLIRLRDQRELQREIDDLDKIERANA